MYTASTKGTPVLVSGHLGNAIVPFLEVSLVQVDVSCPVQIQKNTIRILRTCFILLSNCRAHLFWFSCFYRCSTSAADACGYFTGLFFVGL